MTELPHRSPVATNNSAPSARDREAYELDIDASRSVERRLVWKEGIAALAVVAVLAIRWFWAGS